MCPVYVHIVSLKLANVKMMVMQMPGETVDLIPQKGSNLWKYEKRKRPDIQMQPQVPAEGINPENADISDDELPEITFDEPTREVNELTEKDKEKKKHRCN